MRKKVLGTLLSFFCTIGLYAQSTVLTSPPLTVNNGQAGVTFNLEADTAISITEFYNVFYAGTQTVTIWHNTTAINGSPTVDAANGWNIIYTGTVTGATPNVSTIALPTPLNLQAGTHGFMIEGGSTSSVRYTTWTTANQDTFTDGTVTIYTGQNIGYGGPSPNPTNHPRQFNGGVNYFVTAPCVAPPTAGVVSASDTGICVGASFALSLTSTSIGSGITYQWQSSPDNSTWTNVSGATLGQYTTTQTVDTYYRCVVTCSGQSDTTASFFQPMNLFYSCYCASEANYTSDTKIDEVELSGINAISNPTVCETYTDNTSMVATLVSGGNHVLRIKNGSCSGGNDDGYIGVWIDYDHDGTYQASELVAQFGPTYNYEDHFATVSVPAAALTGLTGMRVVISEATTVSPCGSYSYGETEDYMVDIQSAPTNDAGIVSVDGPIALCNALNDSLMVTFSNNGASALSSFTFNWSINGVLQTPQTVFVNVPALSVDTVSTFINNSVFTPGDVLQMWTSDPNNGTDSYAYNDTATYTVPSPTLSGTYTVDPAGVGPNNFADLTSAVDALNNSGICGPVVFEIANGTYAEQLIFDEVQGASTVNTITFRSASGDTSLCRIEYSLTGTTDGLITFNDLSGHVRFKNLTIQNTGSSGRTIFIDGTVDDIAVDSCMLINPTGSSTTYGVYNYSADVLSNSSFTNNTILYGYYGIYIYGSSTNRDYDNVISNNKMYNQYSRALYLRYNGNVEVSNNEITSDGLSAATSYGMYVYYTVGDSVKITNNHIYQQPGSDYPDYGIYLGYSDGYPFSPLLLQGNAVSLIDAPTTGVYITGCDYVDILNNSSFTYGDGAADEAMYITGTGHRLYNNALAAGNYATALYVSSGVVESDNNAYSSDSTLVYWGGDRNDLLSLQAYSNTDSNSVHIQSQSIFTDTTMLTVCIDSLDGTGAANPTFIQDFQNDPVIVDAVDIGANQFATQNSFTLGDTTAFCPGDTTTLEVFYFDSVVWNMGMHIGNSIDVYTETTFLVDAYNECGMVSSSIYVDEADEATMPTVSYICENDTAELFTSIQNGLAYSWSNGDTTASLMVADSGVYSVTVTDEYGCVSSTSTTAEFSQPVSLPDTSLLCESLGYVLLESNIPGSYSWSTGDATQTITATSEGQYSITVVDNNNCTTEDQTEVVFEDDPVAEFSILTSFYTAQFDNQSVGDSYSWDFGDGTTSTEENPTHLYTWTNDSAITYQVTLVVSNGCGIDSVTYEVTVGTTVGTDEESRDMLVQVYPNPNNGAFDLVINNSEVSSYSYQLMNIEGRVILDKQLGQVSGSINERIQLENAAKGIYLLKINSDFDSKVVRIIVD